MKRKSKNTRRFQSDEDSGDENKAGPSKAVSRRKTSNRIQSSDDDSDGIPLRPSNTSASNITQQSNTNVNTEQINNMVKIFLNLSATKIPIKRSDISKNLNLNLKNFANIYESCANILKEVYGLEVAEIADGKSSKVFIVHSNLSLDSTMQLTSDQRHEVSLLFLVLSYIFMKGGEVQEAHLFHFLNQLNIDTSEVHSVFGDVTKLIREKFPRQLYLKRKKVEIEGTNDPQVHLAWGARSDKEFDAKHVLNAVATIMHKAPACFIRQFHATEPPKEVIEIS